MVGKIARVKIKMVISLVRLSFVFNSEITYFIDIYIIMSNIIAFFIITLLVFYSHVDSTCMTVSFH